MKMLDRGVGLALGLLSALGATPATATTVGPLTALGTAPAGAAQLTPVLSWDGTNYLIVWSDSRNVATGVDLYFVRIAPDGTRVDANALSLLTPLQNGDQTQPAIAYQPPLAPLPFEQGRHVVTWIDPRGGGGEVYFSRIRPDATLLEPGGTALTAGDEAEGQPAVGCTTQACLIAWQSTDQGITQIFGARVDPAGDVFVNDLPPVDLVNNNTGASSELTPSVLGTAAGFFVAWEDDRNVAGGTGADLFGRSVSDLSPSLSPIAGTLLVSANLRQSSVELAGLGADVLAVWQHQTSTMINDDNILRNRFTTALTALDAPAAVTQIAMNQIQPAVATGASSGLVVWEDFRSGGFGLTYASRVDAQGNALEPRGFPVIVGNGNVIQQRIVKGPGSDYLVAAVQSPAPEAIMYRVVRDELPTGTMNPTGTLQVPADGQTPATVVFGPARGALPDAYPVVEGTLYTLTTTGMGLVIAEPDVDAQRAGHQVEAIGGQITISLRSLRPQIATVAVQSVEGTSVGGPTNVDFENVAPVADTIVITPSAPDSGDDLTVSYNYSDINGDAEGTTQIEWTKNAQVQPAWANQRTVPAAAIARNDLWRVRVRPHDGTNFGIFANGPTVVIANSPPEALDPRIQPTVDVPTATLLTARYNYDDPDNDPETGSVLRWYESGAEQTTLRDEDEVPAAMVQKGQSWFFTILPNDGTATGPLVSSATVTIINTAPVADAGPNGSVVERREYTLDATGSGDIDPADVLSYAWIQVAGPAVQLSSTTTPTPSFTAPSVQSTEPVELSLTVNDGTVDSAPNTVVVLITPVPDADADGLDDEEEALAGTDPASGDTDRDGLGDGDEIAAGADPLDGDSDDDGVRDGAEVEPGEDADGDGRPNVLDEDSDDDGLFDGTEQGVTTAIDDTDTSAGFFVPDEDPDSVTDPTRADTDGDQLDDGTEDANRNGRVDLGESDPNDPTSTVGCTPAMECPDGLVCSGNACRNPAGPDAGLVCTALADDGLECCRGGCVDGTLVAPSCVVSGAREQCPTGAQRCSIGSCSGGTEGGGGGDDGCSCTALSAPDRGGRWGLLALLLLLTSRRRRR